MKKLVQFGIALLLTGAFVGCSGEKPLTEEESMAGVLKGANVSPEGKARDKGMTKADEKPASTTSQ